MRHTHTKESLAPLVAASDSYRDVVRRLGLKATCGGNNAYVKRLVLKFQLDTSHFRGQRNGQRGGWNKGVPNDLSRRGAAVRLVLGDPADARIEAFILRRCLLEIGCPHVCEVCGQPPEWHGAPLVLQVDHKNGMYWDNRSENLRFTCPNCHSQTENFGVRNLGVTERLSNWPLARLEIESPGVEPDMRVRIASSPPD